MTRGKRRLVAGICLGLVWSWFTGYLWLQHWQQFDQSRPDVAIYEFGAVHWLTLNSSGSPPSTVTWHVQPLRVLLLAVISLVLGVFDWLIWRWIVRNSALRGRCDRCGYSLGGQPPSDRCPECGEISPVKERQLEITDRSWQRLLIALVLAGIGGAGMTAAVLSQTLQTYRLATKSGNPTWNYLDVIRVTGGWLFYLFLLAALSFAIWLYLEPNKPRARN